MPSAEATYRVRRVFRVPVDFAYAWCTDYTDLDRQLRGRKAPDGSFARPDGR